MNRSQSSLVLSLLLVFSSGVAVGTVGHYLYTAKSVNATSLPPATPDSFRNQFVEEMRLKVGLQGDQLTNLIKVLDETGLQYKEVRDRMKPDMKRIKNEQIEKINAFLSPDQQKLYQQLRADRDEKSKKAKSVAK